MSWSVLTGDYNSSIEAVYIEDINEKTFNRTLKNLYKNDSIIITEIEENTQTDKITVSKIESYQTDTVAVRASKLIIKGNIYQIGKITDIQASELTIHDSVLTVNTYELGPSISLNKAGIAVQRDTDVYASFLFSETDEKWSASNSGLVTKTVEVNDVSTASIILDNYDGEATPESNQAIFYQSSIGDDQLIFLKYNVGLPLILSKGAGEYKNQIRTQEEFEDFLGSSTLRGAGVTEGGSSYIFAVDPSYVTGTDRFLNEPSGIHDQSGNFSPMRGNYNGGSNGAYYMLGGTYDNLTDAWEVTTAGTSENFVGISSSGIYGNLAIAIPPGTNRNWANFLGSGNDGIHILYLPKNANDDKEGGYFKLYYDSAAFINAFDTNSSLVMIDQYGSVYKDAFADDSLVVTHEGVLGKAGGGDLRISGKVTVTLPDETSILIKKGEYRLSTEINLSNNTKVDGQNINNTIIKVANKRAKFIANGIENFQMKDCTIDGSAINTGSAIITSSQAFVNGDDGELNFPKNIYNTADAFIPIGATVDSYSTGPYTTGTDVELTSPDATYDTVANFIPISGTDSGDDYFSIQCGDRRWGKTFGWGGTPAGTTQLIPSENVGSTYGAIYFDTVGQAVAWSSYAPAINNGLKTMTLPKSADGDSLGGSFKYYYHRDAWMYAFAGFPSPNIHIAQNGSVYKEAVVEGVYTNLVVRWDNKVGPAGSLSPEVTEDIPRPYGAAKPIELRVGDNLWKSSAIAGTNDKFYGSGIAASGVYGQVKLSAPSIWGSFSPETDNGLYSIQMPKYFHEDNEGGYINYFYNSEYWTEAFNGTDASILITQNGSIYKNNYSPSSLINTWDGNIGSALASSLESALLTNVYENTQTNLYRDTSSVYSAYYDSLFELNNSKNINLGNNITGFSKKIVFKGNNSERIKFGNVFSNSSICFQNLDKSYYFGRYSSNLRTFLNCNGFAQCFAGDEIYANGSNIIYGQNDFNF